MTTTVSQLSLALEAQFVDREREQNTLRTLLHHTYEGRGCVVFIAGEAGVGKTRLAREIGHYAEFSGSVFLEGSSYEHEGIIPYSPWIDILHSLVKRTSVDSLRKLQGWMLAEIGRLVPALLARAEELGLKGWLMGPRASSMTASSTDQDRVRLFQAVVDFLASEAGRHPIVIFLDDIGWADTASLQLFHYVARRAPQHKLMLIAAYRDTELPEEHPLTKMALDLNRQRTSRTISVTRFNQEYVSKLLKAHMNGPVSGELSQLIYTRTGGNPFFVEEIVRSLMDDGLLSKSPQGWALLDQKDVQIPTSIRAIIRQRTGKLGEECLNLLSIASLAGMEFDFDIVKRAAGYTEEASMGLLEAAMSSQLVREKRRGSKVYYSFSDEQVRDFLAEQVSLLRKRKYHLALGEALESAYKDTIEDHVAEIANHFLEAADVPRARDYSIRAGERAVQLHAHSDALKHYKNALELVDERDLKGRLDLLTRLGRIGYVRANYKEVLQFCGEAVKVAESLGARGRIAELYGMIGVSCFFHQNSPKEAVENLIKGLGAIKDSEDIGQEASLCSQLGRVLSLTGEIEQGRSWVEKAIELATKAGAYEALAHSYQTVALCLPIKDKNLIIEYYQKALSLSIEHGLEDSMLRAYNNLSGAYSNIKGDLKRSRELLLEGIKRARSSGYVEHELFMLGGLVWTDFYLGEWKACEAEAQEVIKLANELGWKNRAAPYLALGAIALARGDLPEAARILDIILPIVTGSGRAGSMGPYWFLAGQIHLVRNELDKAEEAFLSALRSGRPVWGEDAIEPLFELVRLSLKKGNLDKSTEYYQGLDRRASEFGENWTHCFELWARGLISESRGDVKEAIDALLECTVVLRESGRRYDLPQALVDLSRCQAKVGQNREVEKSLEEARDIFHQLGITRKLAHKQD